TTLIQNIHMEIFNHVTIINAGKIRNYEFILKTYGNESKKIKQDKYLKQLIQKVMIRNTRKQSDLTPSKRHIETVWVDFTDEEQYVYDRLETSIEGIAAFTKLTLLREIC